MIEGFIIFLVVMVLIFLVCREIVCWYWKQNEICERLESILAELKKLNGEKPAEQPAPETPDAVPPVLPKRIMIRKKVASASDAA